MKTLNYLRFNKCICSALRKKLYCKNAKQLPIAKFRIRQTTLLYKNAHLVALIQEMLQISKML